MLLINSLTGIVLYILYTYPTVFFTVAYLALLSYLDHKYREIDENILYLGVVVSGILLVLTIMRGIVSFYEVLLSLVILGVLAGITWVLSRHGMLGEGDVYVILIVGLANVKWFFIKINGYIIPVQPLITTLLLGGIIIVLYGIISNIVHNVRNKDLVSKLHAGKMEKIIYFLIGKYVRSETLEKMSNVMLLHDGEAKVKHDVNRDPLHGSDYVKEGRVKGEVAVVVDALPGIISIFVGYLLFVVFYTIAPVIGVYASPCTISISG
jgi:hypothetical protein